MNLAHLRERAQRGGYIDFAVFEARSNTGDDISNGAVLRNLTARARSQGLKIDQSALVFRNGTRTQFYGDKPLVNYLSESGVPRWTHTIDA